MTGTDEKQRALTEAEVPTACSWGRLVPNLSIKKETCLSNDKNDKFSIFGKTEKKYMEIMNYFHISCSN